MKKILFLFLLLPFGLHAETKKELLFEENKGQAQVRGGTADVDVKFILRGKTLTYYFSDRGYSVVQRDSSGLICRTDFFFPQGKICKPEALNEVQQKTIVLQSSGTVRLKSFQKIIYRNFSEGEDMEFSVQGNSLERKLLIHSSVHTAHLYFEMRGAELSITSDAPGYSFKTAAGTFSERLQPVQNGLRVSGFITDPEWLWPLLYPEYSIDAGTHFTDSTATNATISWLTYIGGTSADELFGIALLTNNGSVVAGRTNSTDFPSTAGAMQDSIAGSYDVTVNRFDSAGLCLWSTLYGGTGFEGAYGVLVADSLIVVYGNTNSADLPMLNAYQDSCAGSYDAFVIMLNDSGMLVRSSYFGGTGADQAFSMAIDTSGNLVMAGSTTSINLPLAASGYQPVPAGAIDAFIATFNLQLQPLWSTCYGGSSSEDIHSVTVSPQGEIIFCGGTYSTSFPVTANAWQNAILSLPDIYLVKFGMDGTRHYATFFGGTNSEDANTVVCDSLGNAYITGFTFSTDFPIQGNSFATIHGAQSDAYLAKFDSTGQLAWSTFIGGNGAESGIALYRFGKYLFAAGNTESSDFPVSPNALQSIYAGNSDGFFVKMDTAGNMVNATFSGAGGVEAIYGLTITPDDTSVIACGDTYSNNLPVTPGAFQQTYGGSGDGYVLKFGMSEELSTVSANSGIHFENGTITVYPNPAAEFIKLVSTDEYFNRVEIFDAAGRIVFVKNMHAQQTEIDIQPLAKGVYSIVTYSGKDSRQVLKLVKE